MKKLKYNTKPIFIKDKNVRTIDLSIVYPIKCKKEDTYNYEIMVSLLNTRSGAYSNEHDFSVEVSKRLIIHYAAIMRSIGEHLFIRFDLSVPEDGLVDNFDMEEAFKFFKDTITHPYAENRRFNEAAFERERDYISARLNDARNNDIYFQSYTNFIKLVDEEEEVFTSHESNLGYLSMANAKRSYELYEEAILNNDPIVYVFGNFMEDKISPLLEKYFPSSNKEIVIPLEYDKIFHPVKHEYVEEVSKFNQTALFMLFDVKDIKPEEKEYISLVGNILGQSENDLIFKELRFNNNLVYSTSVDKYVYNGLILIETHLNYANKDEAIKLVKETLNSLKDEKFLKECVDRLIKGVEVDLLRSEDSKYGKLVHRMDTDLHMRPLKMLYDTYKKMKIDDIIKFIGRIELNTVYLLRGEEND